LSNDFFVVKAVGSKAISSKLALSLSLAGNSLLCLEKGHAMKNQLLNQEKAGCFGF